MLLQLGTHLPSGKQGAITRKFRAVESREEEDVDADSVIDVASFVANKHGDLLWRQCPLSRATADERRVLLGAWGAFSARADHLQIIKHRADVTGFLGDFVNGIPAVFRLPILFGLRDVRLRSSAHASGEVCVSVTMDEWVTTLACAHGSVRVRGLRGRHEGLRDEAELLCPGHDL